jgi:hypothetical protein
MKRNQSLAAPLNWTGTIATMIRGVPLRTHNEMRLIMTFSSWVRRFLGCSPKPTFRKRPVRRLLSRWNRALPRVEVLQDRSARPKGAQDCRGPDPVQHKHAGSDPQRLGRRPVRELDGHRGAFGRRIVDGKQQGIAQRQPGGQQPQHAQGYPFDLAAPE